MVSKPATLVLAGLVFISTSSSESFVQDGKKFVKLLYVSFNREVVALNEADSIGSVENIKPEFSELAKYLERIGMSNLEQIFKGTKWSDTLFTNLQGQVVRSPQLAKWFKFRFEKSIPEKETIDSLKRFPEIRSVSGPAKVIH